MPLIIQIFGTPKCQDTNKALRFFKERGLKPHFVDLREKPVTKGELDNITRIIPVDNLIDKEGKEYKKANLEYMVFDIEEKLLENPFLFKTPITRSGKNVTIGYQPEIWKKWIEEDKKKG